MILTTDEKTPEIFAKIHEITRECFHGIELPPVGVLQENFRIGTVFVDSKIALHGFAIVRLNSGEARLWIIAVSSKYQCRGIGDDLLSEIEEYIGGNPIGLTCKPDNPAQKLYFDHGYRVTRVLRDFYGPEGAGLFMRRG